MKTLGIIYYIFFMLTIGLFILSLLPGTGIYPEHERDKVVCDGHGVMPGYSYTINSRQELEAYLKAVPVEFSYEWLAKLNTLVFGVLRHQPRYITFRENWLLWMLGKVYEPFSRATKGRQVLDAGYGNCSEAMFALSGIFEKLRISYRHISLRSTDESTGHSLLEGELNGRRYVFDPDLGLSFPASFDVLQGEEGLVFLLKEFENKDIANERQQQYIENFQGKDNDYILPHGYTSRMARFQEFSQVLKWILPLSVSCILVVLMLQHIQQRFNVHRGIFLRYFIACYVSLFVIVYCYVVWPELSLRVKALVGNVEGLYGLALLNHSRGCLSLVKNDGSSAFRYFRTAHKLCEYAAQDGFSKAQSKLGILFLRGWWGGQKNYPAARYWFGKAAAQGDYDAKFYLMRDSSNHLSSAFEGS